MPLFFAGWSLKAARKALGLGMNLDWISLTGGEFFFALLTAAQKAIEQASRFYFLALEAQLYILFGISLIALHF